jgi:hypothetical protein
MSMHTQNSKLQTLRLYLKHLPCTLPAPNILPAFDFRTFEPDPEWVQSEGLEIAVNRALEVALGPRNGPSGTFQLNGHGPGVQALADVLEKYLRECPGSFFLSKWIEDACRSAEEVYTSAQILVCLIYIFIFELMATTDAKHHAAACSFQHRTPNQALTNHHKTPSQLLINHCKFYKWQE